MPVPFLAAPGSGRHAAAAALQNALGQTESKLARRLVGEPRFQPAPVLGGNADESPQDIAQERFLFQAPSHLRRSESALVDQKAQPPRPSRTTGPLTSRNGDLMINDAGKYQVKNFAPHRSAAIRPPPPRLQPARQ